MAAYDRYSKVRMNGDVGIIPFVRIPERGTDFYEVYHKNSTRLDVLSYNYYKSPDYGWLILQANPDVATIEYDIPDNTILRIPYPIDEVLRHYDESLENILNKR